MVTVPLILGLLVHTYTVVQCQENYNVTYYSDDKPCFSVNLRLTATICYQDVDNNISRVDIVGNDFAASNTCNISSELGSASINISWPSTDPYYSLYILFSADFQVGWNVTKMIFLVNTNNTNFFDPSEVIVTRVHDMKSCTLDDPNNHVLLIVKEGLDYFELHNERDLTVDNITLKKSYKCDSNVTHSFSSSGSNSTAIITTTNLQLQAFRFNNDEGRFGQADMQCVEDIDDSKVLPIIVGTVITLVLLVALMLYILLRVVRHRRDSKRSLLTERSY